MAIINFKFWKKVLPTETSNEKREIHRGNLISLSIWRSLWFSWEIIDCGWSLLGQVKTKEKWTDDSDDSDDSNDKVDYDGNYDDDESGSDGKGGGGWGWAMISCNIRVVALSKVALSKVSKDFKLEISKKRCCQVKVMKTAVSSLFNAPSVTSSIWTL